MGSAAEKARFFTVQEANALLPTLKPAVEKLVDTARRYRPVRRRLEKLAAYGARVCANAEMPEAWELAHKADRLWRQLQRRIRDVERFGCMVKDVQKGLVDFFAVREEEAVFLCWQLGEAKVSHWHPVDEGFAGRRAV